MYSTIPRSQKTSTQGVLVALFCLIAIRDNASAQTKYDFGNPSDLDQELIEQINWARANPTAEGERLASLTDPFVLQAYTFFNVDLNLMRAELAAIPVAPPLAPNKKLADAALGHSQWMFDNKLQLHDQINPTKTTAQRITESGYNWTSIGESIFAFAHNITHCHAGFEVDWGNDGGTGGMQLTRSHRVSNHNLSYREIGIGIIQGTNSPVGPMVITEKFAKDNVGSRYFATGVAYYDLDGDNFYDAGEGIEGLRVDASGTGISHFSETALGGGWVIPMTTTGLSRTITFSAPGFSQNVPMTVPANANAKADLKLSYTRPTITSPLATPAAVPYPLTFNSVVGAKEYRWDTYSLDNAPPEHCENLNNVATQVSPAYTPLNNSVFSQGTASFHLKNSVGKDQSLELSTLYLGSADSSLTFSSRIRFATTAELFLVQVKEEGALNWLTVDTQAGTGGAGQNAFENRIVPIGAMDGKRFRVRFLLQSTGSFFTSTDDFVGWFIDAIQFTNVRRLTPHATGTTTSTSASFSLPIGSYLLSVSPKISGRNFPASSAFIKLNAGPALPTYVSEMTQLETQFSLTPGSLANFPFADHDDDDLPNIIEYSIGTSAVGANVPPLFPSALVSQNRFVFRYRLDTSLTEIDLIPQTSIDLINWKALGAIGAPAGFTDTLISEQGEVQFREAGIPLSNGIFGFIRIVAKPK